MPSLLRERGREREGGREREREGEREREREGEREGESETERQRERTGDRETGRERERERERAARVAPEVDGLQRRQLQRLQRRGHSRGPLRTDGVSAEVGECVWRGTGVSMFVKRNWG